MVDSFGGFMQLPIRRRGNFKKDDFFKGFQDDFDSAIQDVMNKYTGRSLLADQFSNYRKMRENSNEAGPAASISETKESSVIVLDMSDFVKGSIAVRTRGRYVIVEASNDSVSFNRKFPLAANTNFDGIKSAMSNEGILTITAPKKVIGTPTATVSNGNKQDSPSLKIDIGEPENGISSEGQTTSSSTTNVTSHESELGGAFTPPVDKELSISQKGNFFQDKYFQNVWKDFENAMDEMVHKEEQRKQKSKAEKRELVNNLKKEMLMEAGQKQKEFFEKTRQKEAATEMRIPTYDRMNSYMNLRSWDPDTETQAATITKDASGYKIVMDVKNNGNGDGDVSVKASEGLLTVTGRRGPLTFKREFTLQGLTNPDQVSASVSEDGILTISVTF